MLKSSGYAPKLNLNSAGDTLLAVFLICSVPQCSHLHNGNSGTPPLQSSREDQRLIQVKCSGIEEGLQQCQQMFSSFVA